MFIMDSPMEAAVETEAKADNAIAVAAVSPKIFFIGNLPDEIIVLWSKLMD